MWEYGISRCKELAYQYESETYDYIQLSKILVSTIFISYIFNPNRVINLYYRISYFLRNVYNYTLQLARMK